MKNNLIGLVLCGGKSSRMKADKAFIEYYNMPHAYYLYNQIAPICEQVFLCCNQNQIAQIDKKYNYLVDNNKHQNLGPIAAIITALATFENQSFLVLACDYPLLTFNEITELIAVWDKNKQSVSFYNTETKFREPLLAIYHQNDLQKLIAFYQAGNSSLNNFLNVINAKKLAPKLNQNIVSIDTEEAYQKTNSILNSK